MSLLRITSPHAHGPLSTTRVMQTVLLATLPGVAALAWFFGPGVLVNIAVTSFFAIAFEAAALLAARDADADAEALLLPEARERAHLELERRRLRLEGVGLRAAEHGAGHAQRLEDINASVCQQANPSG